MNLQALARQAYTEAAARRPYRLMIACTLGIVFSVMFPTDLASYRTAPATHNLLVDGTDRYGRYLATAVQIALPIVYRDPVGMMQNLFVGLGTTALTHGLKHLVNGLTIWDARLGERPSGPGSRHNMPSGHSSMASCAVWFVGRRYGWRWGLLIAPIMLLTMFARVELHAHTIAAVMAGVAIGVLAAAWFTSRRSLDASDR